MNLKELNSFKLSDAVTFHDKLNPKLWNGTKLRPDVREQLLVIAQDFLQELGVHDLDVKDITISGSNAAYSYTKHSDLDLHILVDMGNLPVDEVYKELFTAKKTIYNDTHDIKINNIPVELYVQDSRQPVVSLGEYSVMNDQWIRIPTKRRSDFDQTATKSKYEKLLSLIEIALQSKKYSKVKHIIDTIKRYRQAGLDKGGEFGPENLAYKMLRSQGYITKLYELRDKLHSEKLSFETMYQNIDEDEQFNNELWKPGLDFKQDINGILYHVTNAGKKNDFLSIKAYDKKNPNPIGDAQFAKARNLYTGEVQGVTSMKTRVDPKYQGQGIAANMYALIRMLGVNVLPSETQTTAGQKMWSKWRKQGDVNSLKDLDPKVKAVKEELEQMPSVLYHATYKQRLKSIKLNGLGAGGKRNWTDSKKGVVYLALDPNVAESYAETALDDLDADWDIVILQVSTNGLDPSKFHLDSNVQDNEGDTVEYHGIIPPSNISLYKSGVAEEYNTMQFASEKTPAINPYGGRKDNQYRGSMSEAFDNPYKSKWEKSESGSYDALVRLPDGTNLSIMFNNEGDDEYQVEFYRNNSQEVTGEGDAQRVFATVLNAIQKFVKKHNPWRLRFSATKDVEPGQNSESRAKLYNRLVDRYANALGYDTYNEDHGDQITYELTRLKPTVAEASGYIPSEKQKNDPRFKTALTVDVHPDTIKKNAKAFYWNTSRAGIPPTAKANGKIS